MICPESNNRNAFVLLDTLTKDCPSKTQAVAEPLSCTLTANQTQDKPQRAQEELKHLQKFHQLLNKL